MKENVLLKEHTTMRVGGPARFYIEVRDENELRGALLQARRLGQEFFILGDGSNIVVSDDGIDAVVIKMATRGIEYREEKNSSVLVVVGAGENWDSLVKKTISKKLCGLENLSLIPGTVGAAPIQNIGAYGVEVKEMIEWIEILDTAAMQTKKLSNDECAFGYRDSIFKKPENKHLVIMRAAFRLSRNAAPLTDYKDVAEYFKNEKVFSPTSPQVRDAVIAIRRAKLPDPAEVGTAGSFFKNPVVSKVKYGELRRKYPQLPGFNTEGGGIKIPIAWILDAVCRIKGVRRGHVGTHEKQPLALVHDGEGTANEIKNFAEELREKVFEKTGIMPEYEVSFVGEYE